MKTTCTTCKGEKHVFVPLVGEVLDGGRTHKRMVCPDCVDGQQQTDPEFDRGYKAGQMAELRHVDLILVNAASLESDRQAHVTLLDVCEGLRERADQLEQEGQP